MPCAANILFVCQESCSIPNASHKNTNHLNVHRFFCFSSFIIASERMKKKMRELIYTFNSIRFCTRNVVENTLCLLSFAPDSLHRSSAHYIPAIKINGLTYVIICIILKFQRRQTKEIIVKKNKIKKQIRFLIHTKDLTISTHAIYINNIYFLDKSKSPTTPNQTKRSKKTKKLSCLNSIGMEQA